MFNEPGDWVAAYNPERDGNFDEWLERVRAEYAPQPRVISFTVPESIFGKISSIAQQSQSCLEDVFVSLLNCSSECV